jgi:hypothetical protein
VGQVRKEMAFPVTYVSSTAVYIGAGSDDSLAVGDTLSIIHASKQISKATTIAVSRQSTAAQIIWGTDSVMVGDMATITKVLAVAEEPRWDTVSVLLKNPLPSVPQRENRPAADASSAENIVSGRVALQYSGVLAEDSRFNISQPSMLMRLDVGRLFGTGLKFSIYGRSYYDLSANFNRYGDSTRLQVRMYDFALSDEQPDATFGYSAGRVTSRFVGGFGTFDGGQFYYRMGHFTSGILYGAKVADRTMAIDGDDRRGAFFVNYHTGSDFLHLYDGTIAYARQLYEGRLDREFFYVQNLAAFGPEINLYHSAEIETQQISNGVRTTSPKLSNMFLSVNYYPLDWLAANAGYDASETVYLFESMKSFSDTLLDKFYLQGYRANATLRLSNSIVMSVNGAFRSRKDDPRAARTLGTSFRFNGIGGSDYNAEVRYMNLHGVYNNGADATLDVDKTFFTSLTVALRLDYYTYTLLTNDQTYKTYTATADIYCMISRNLYSSLNFDSVWDSTMNSYRIYVEVGIRW